MQERNLETAEKLHDELQQLLEQRKHRHTVGIAALQRLVKVAQGDTGQSGVVGRFLLGLYNGDEFPFDLVDLRRLDTDLHDDCISVLRLDYTPVQEVHRYFKNGDRIWRELKANWGGAR